MTKRHEIRPYAFTGGDYLGFPMSHDVHGTGRWSWPSRPGTRPAPQVALLREMLYAIIGSAEDPGSCL